MKATRAMSDDSVSINDISVEDLGDAVVVIAVDKSKQSEDAFDSKCWRNRYAGRVNGIPMLMPASRFNLN